MSISDELLREVVKPRSRQATSTELALFRQTCERTGLDPLARQVYATFRRNQGGQEVMSVQATIDGFRAVAERSGDYLGGDAPQWCGSDAQWQDVWLSDEPPTAARVTVRKAAAGQVAPTTVVAHWREYAPNTSQPAGRMWKQMPALMLAKVAEALALRRAFPMVLSGVYTGEEMAQASSDGTVTVGFTSAPESAPPVVSPSEPDHVATLRAYCGEHGLKWGEIKAAYARAGLAAPDYARQAFLDLTDEEALRLLAALQGLETDVPADGADLAVTPPESAEGLPWDGAERPPDGDGSARDSDLEGQDGDAPAPSSENDALVDDITREFPDAVVEGASEEPAKPAPRSRRAKS